MEAWLFQCQRATNTTYESMIDDSRTVHEAVLRSIRQRLVRVTQYSSIHPYTVSLVL